MVANASSPNLNHWSIQTADRCHGRQVSQITPAICCPVNHQPTALVEQVARRTWEARLSVGRPITVGAIMYRSIYGNSLGLTFTPLFLKVLQGLNKYAIRNVAE